MSKKELSKDALKAITNVRGKMSDGDRAIISQREFVHRFFGLVHLASAAPRGSKDHLQSDISRILCTPPDTFDSFATLSISLT
jgi:hypothetical protein